MKPVLAESAYVDVACPLCGDGSKEEVYRGERPTGTFLGRVAVVVAQCSGCGFVFNSPRPSDEHLARYYAEDALASGRTYRDDGADAYYPQLFEDRARFYAPILAAYAGTGAGTGGRALRLLDVGCGQGGFLRALAARLPGGWELSGLEPCERSAPIAASAGFEVRQAFLSEAPFPDDSFDAVSLISVLEHLTDPAAAMARVARLLRPGGLCLLEVPNTLHPELSLTSYFGLEHVCHFTPGTLSRLCRESGLLQLRLDDRVRDHGLRLVAGADLGLWGCREWESFADDRALARQRLEAYTRAEGELLAELDRRVRRTLDRWRSQGLTIAVYGAGAHTAELDAHVGLWDYATVLVDGDDSKQGTRFLGQVVHAPEELGALGVQAVLLSSHRFAHEMEATVRRLCGERVAVARCYGPDTPTFVT